MLNWRKAGPSIDPQTLKPLRLSQTIYNLFSSTSSVKTKMSLSSVAAGELGQRLYRNHVLASKVGHEVQFGAKVNKPLGWLNCQPKGDQVSSPALQLSLILDSLGWY